MTKTGTAHENAARLHARRAKRAAADLRELAETIALALEFGRPVEAESARRLGELAALTGVHLGALEVLRDLPGAPGWLGVHDGGEGEQS